jgi:uncharacterized glyoxalase superfamily metalloenzyme YdcJ
MASTSTLTLLSNAFNPTHKPEDMFVDADNLRTTFALGLSAMYKAEVPLYGDLVRLVQAINQSNFSISDSTPDKSSLERLTLERHGAIRLGTDKELRAVRRIFTILGMHPVGYYDLSKAGLPMHATCFRPTNPNSLQRNPFRVFTTILRPDLLRSNAARDLAMSLLEQRQIISEELLSILDTAEMQDNKLTTSQAERFIIQALLTFSWQSVAAATYPQYALLKDEHPILADIACFRSAHINHLTPRVLDIKAAQEAMQDAGMAVKSRIEGPPERKCPILLRQTSFLALEEKINFLADTSKEDGYDSLVLGCHKARFGEIEQRGAAVTPAGRQLYDNLLDEAMARAQANLRGLDPQVMDGILTETFKQYPDDWSKLRRAGLVYSEFSCTGKAIDASKVSTPGGQKSRLEQLIEDGILEAVPITYEDFLPLSAAGIFQSNLHVTGKSIMAPAAGEMGGSYAGLETFEHSLGCALLNADQLYAVVQRQSLEACATTLGLTVADLRS